MTDAVMGVPNSPRGGEGGGDGGLDGDLVGNWVGLRRRGGVQMGVPRVTCQILTL